jgi:hypothetical protein
MPRKYWVLYLAIVLALTILPRPAYAFDTYLPTVQGPMKLPGYLGYPGYEPPLPTWATLKDGLYKYNDGGASASFSVSGNGSYASNGEFQIPAIGPYGFFCPASSGDFPGGAAIQNGKFSMSTETAYPYFGGSAMSCQSISDTDATCSVVDISASMTGDSSYSCGMATVTLTRVSPG